MDIQKLREDTPCEGIYLNHVSTSVPPRQVIRAVNDYFETAVRCGSTSARALSINKPRYRAGKETVAAFIGARGKDLVYTPNGSQAIGLVAAGLPVKAGDNVIVDEMSFVGNVAPWLRLRDRFGVQVRFCPGAEPGVIDLERLRRLIDERTRLIAVTHMANNLGILQPAAEIGRIAREAGVLYLLDACNTVGALPIDVEEIGCDFLAASGRKYLRGPAGSGFLYAREEAADRLVPCLPAWNSGTWDWRAPDLSESAFIPLDGAERLSFGEIDYPAAFGLARAVEYAGEIGGIGEIAARIKDLTARMVERLLAIPDITLYGTQSSELRAGMVGFNVGKLPFAQVTDYLAGHGVGLMGHSFFSPGVLRMFGIDGVVRFCVHCWNTEEEIDEACRLLEPSLLPR